jgi:LemA protein
MIIVILVALGLAFLFVFSLIAAHNRVVRAGHQVANARHQIDVQLARRHDLIPNLVELVKGAMAHEQHVLIALADARADAVRALQDEGGDWLDSFEAEGRLSSALAPVLSFVEAQPHLMSLDNVRALQEELASTENRIAFARQHYNDSVTRHREVGEEFPANLLRRKAGSAELWSMPEGSERVPRVDLGLGNAAG